MDIFARNRTLSHMRTNEAWISMRNCALFIVYIYICPYSRKQIMGLHALIRLHKCLSLQLAYVDSYKVHLLLQWPRQFELLKRRLVKACGARKSCRFYVSLNILHVYFLFFSFSIYFTKIEWLCKKDSERRQIIIIIIPWTVCSHISNKQTDNENLIIHLEFLHTKTYLMPYVNSEGPNQNVNCHYLWWSGICSSSGAFCQMEIIVAGYYGFTLDIHVPVRVPVRPSSVRRPPSVRFSFPYDNLSNHQWIFT